MDSVHQELSDDVKKENSRSDPLRSYRQLKKSAQVQQAQGLSEIDTLYQISLKYMVKYFFQDFITDFLICLNKI